MPNPENNLVSLFNKVFDGTGHKKLSKANRAHQWMQNHSFDGPCLTFLSNCITEDNFVAVEEMNLFKKLEAKGDLPNESEIDTLLAEFLGETSIDLESMHTSSVQGQLFQAEKYFKALDEQERILRRHCNKLREEISTKSAETPIPESQDTASVQEAYSEAWKQIQSELSNTLEMVFTLLTADGHLNEFLTPAPSSEGMKMFHDTVDMIIQKRFYGIDANEAAVADEHARDIISVAGNLGRLNYQRTKLQCEEAELTELDCFIAEISKNTDIYTADAAHLRSLLKPRLEETDSLQQKITGVSERLENLLTESVVHNMLVAYRQGLSQRKESEYEFMKEMAASCVKYVDLLTLLACLAGAKEWTIDALFALFDFTRQKLNEHRKQHLSTVMKLTKLESGDEEERDEENTLSTSSCFENEEEKQILPSVAKYLGTFSAVKRELDDLERLIFNGPVRSKIFFSHTLLNDEVLVRRQYYQFKRQVEMWTAQYDKVKRENEHLDEVAKCYRTLGLLFLANADGNVLRSNLKQFRDMGSRTMTIVPGNINCTFHNSSRMDAEKVNRTSY